MIPLQEIKNWYKINGAAGLSDPAKVYFEFLLDHVEYLKAELDESCNFVDHLYDALGPAADDIFDMYDGSGE